MKEKLFLVSTAFFICTGAGAQVSKDSISRVIAREMCVEFEKKDFSKIKREDLEMEMGMLMLPSITNHQAEIEQAFGVSSIADEGVMEKVGMEIGKNMVLVCPSFAKAFMTMADNDTKKADGAEKELKATVLKVVPGDFTHLLVKGNDGKTEKIWVFDHFTGAELLLDNPAAAAGKKVTVSYTQQEVYNATLKQYLGVKVASGVKLEK